jgi:hypothetical protein
MENIPSIQKYTGKDNYGKPKQEYLIKLAAQTDEQLYDSSKQMIWLSAYANNNPRSDYHWQCDACYDECVKRGKVEIYERAHKANMDSL